MSGGFRIDPDKLRVPGEDFDGGPDELPPGAEMTGLIQDSQVGRHAVRFVFLLEPVGDVPRYAAFWHPPRPKRLKDSTFRQYRRARLEFAAHVAQEFGVGVQVIDRSSGAPHNHLVLPVELVSEDGAVTEFVYEDGAVDPPAPSVVVH
jgi:hypothetical protein